MTFLKTYLITFGVFFVVDLVWLGVVAKNMYRNQIGFIMKASPNWLAAIIFYLIYIVGIIIFVINPALDAESFSRALLMGLLFGFMTYMTYDLTNLATLKDWPLKLTIIDIIWGTSLGGIVSSVSYLLVRNI